MARIIPGVQVSVVKEVLPQQLAPSGVLGIVGLTEKDLEKGLTVGRAASWSRFIDVFGPGTAYSIPEAHQALDNGVFELVVSPITSDTASSAYWTLKDKDNDQFRICARTKGVWANDLKVKIATRKGVDGKQNSFDLHIQTSNDDDLEIHRNLSVIPGSSYCVGVLERSSSRVKAESIGEFEFGLAKSNHTFSSDSALTLFKKNGSAVVTISAKSEGEFQIKVEVGTDTAKSGYKISILKRGKQSDEYTKIGDAEYDDLVFPGDASYLIKKLQGLKSGGSEKFFTVIVKNWPVDGEYAPDNKGSNATREEYRSALRHLDNEPDVDMVMASIQDGDLDDVIEVYNDIISHCETMSEDCKGRIGFGQVPLTGTTKDHVNMAGNLVSDRFVLVAPNGVAGAVAGMVGNLDYFRSPTFKRVSGLGKLKTALNIEEQRTLLKGNVVPVVLERGKGIIVLRGLTTDGDQISVRRVADRAVRGVKMIGDLFIGKLNNSDGRVALKQKLIEFLLQMEKEGAIVPSTDGTDPAFKVDVYSSQEDFALGIVRVDLAVRPVRAIDYIYATILVQV